MIGISGAGMTPQIPQMDYLTEAVAAASKAETEMAFKFAQISVNEKLGATRSAVRNEALDSTLGGTVDVRA